MQLIEWQYKNLILPLIKTENGTRYCTSQGLCSALETTSTNLRYLLSVHKDKITPLTVSNTNGHQELSGVSMFLRLYRQQFGIRAVRGDLKLFTLKQALLVAFRVGTDQAWDFQEAVADEIEKQGRESGISIEQFAELEARIAQLEQREDGLSAYASSMATQAGHTLRSYQDVKKLIH